jgi:uncharacterized membrane protein YraQ (UPF0718 family)
MENKNGKSKKLTGGMKLLFIVLALYFIVGIFNLQLAKEAAFSFFYMLLKIIPILFIVFIVMIGADIYFTKEKTGRFVGNESGIKGWIYAIISGILISGPPYILYPLLGNLKKRGMKNSLLAALLYNRNIKIPFIPVMIYYFSLKFTIVISVYIIIFSIFNGILVSVIVEKSLTKSL